MREFTAAARSESAQTPAEASDRHAERITGLEALAGDRQLEAQTARQVGSQLTGIDAGRTAGDAPALRGGPGHLAAQIRVAAKDVESRAADADAIATQLAGDIGGHGGEARHQLRHLSQSGGADVVWAHARQLEASFAAAKGNAASDQRPAKVAPCPLQIQARPARHDPDRT